MTQDVKVLLFKKNSINQQSRFHFGHKGFSVTPSLKEYLAQKVEDISHLLPHSKMAKLRIMIEKSLLKDFYTITLHTRIRGKDLSVQSEDTCLYVGINKSFKIFLGHLAT